MKNIFSKTCLVAGIVLASISGCKDHRMDQMTDDRVYLVNFGVKEQPIYKGEGFVYPVVAAKSGVGRQGGSVSLTVNESILSGYGDQYSLLPSEYYTIKTSQLSFSQDDYLLDFEIDYDVAGIEALNASSDVKYAIPFEIKSTDNGLKLTENEDQHHTIIVPKVVTPYVSFKDPGLQGTSSEVPADGPEETKFYVFVSTNFNNAWDLSYQVDVDEQALADYNEANETEHVLLPEAAYRVDNSSFVIPSKNNEWSFDYYLLKGKVPAGSYMLPLRISSVSKFGVDPDRSLRFIPVVIR